MRNPSWANIAAGVIFVFNSAVNAQENYEGALTIRLYDTAATTPAILSAATAAAARILRAAGVQVTWQTAPNDSPEAHLLDFRPVQGGESPDGRDYLAVRLVAGLPDTAAPKLLGFALPGARFGSHVTILWDRIDHRFAKFGKDEATILGYLMAHEIGHVLLGSAEHSAAGLMKGQWNDADIALAATGRLYFSRIQCARMREAVRRRQESHAALNPPLAAIARSARGSLPAPEALSVQPRPTLR